MFGGWTNYFYVENFSHTEESAKDEYFERNFAWHAITQYDGSITAVVRNATIMFLKPVPDLSAKDRLGLLVNS